MLTEALAWLGLEPTTFNLISILVVLGLALIVFGFWGAHRIVALLSGENDRSHETFRSRREAKEAKRRRQIAEMNDTQLDLHLKRKPDDVDAVRERLKRFKTAGDDAAHLALSEHYLAVDKSLSVADAAILHHQLADRFLQRSDPAKARAILECFVARHAGTVEAHLALTRIERFAES